MLRQTRTKIWSALFSEWRSFEAPPQKQGAPDYTLATSRQRAAELPDWQARLAAIDTSGWSVEDQGGLASGPGRNERHGI